MTPRVLVSDGTDLLEPFLDPIGSSFYNPFTGQTLLPDQPGHREVAERWSGRGTLSSLGEPMRQRLRAEGWIIPHRAGWDRRSRLVYVSLEAHTLCNQACVFCPVSVAPRPPAQMTLETYGRIVGQLAAYRATVRAVFMNNYNEPTADRDFMAQVKLLASAGLPPALNTNGSGLTPARVDQLLALGGLAYLSVNLSTLDRARYRTDRGVDLLPRVLANLDYLRDLPLSPHMIIAVLGHEDDDHAREHQRIAAYFASSRLEVKKFTIMDRAQWLNLGLGLVEPHRHLRGCSQTGSRPIEHLHINPQGQCLLCCQDYNERYVVGDLNQQTVAEVLAGDELARQRRLIYGYETAPDNHLCRRCIFACTHRENAV